MNSVAEIAPSVSAAAWREGREGRERGRVRGKRKGEGERAKLRGERGREGQW